MYIATEQERCTGEKSAWNYAGLCVLTRMTPNLSTTHTRYHVRAVLLIAPSHLGRASREDHWPVGVYTQAQAQPLCVGSRGSHRREPLPGTVPVRNLEPAGGLLPPRVFGWGSAAHLPQHPLTPREMACLWRSGEATYLLELQGARPGEFRGQQTPRGSPQPTPIL